MKPRYISLLIAGVAVLLTRAIFVHIFNHKGVSVSEFVALVLIGSLVGITSYNILSAKKDAA